MPAFHVQRQARARYEVEGTLLGLRGDLVITDLAGIRGLSDRMNRSREAGAAPVSAGEIAALGLIHEIGHLLIARYEAERRPRAMTDALAELDTGLGPDAVRLLDRFAQEFPGVGPVPEPPRDRLEELLLIRVANENPALGPLRELVDDRGLARGTRYGEAIARLESIFADGPPVAESGETLFEVMRAPARHSPTSLTGQLLYIREHWGTLLGDALDELIGRLDIAIGILAEEKRALTLRFGGGPSGAGRGPTEAPAMGGLGDEPEAFSSDSAWMPQVVLMAKSTYVWLDQLSRTHGRDIRTLDAIPELYASWNTRRDAPYYNPLNDFSGSLSLVANQILYRRYNFVYSHNFGVTAGEYWEHGFGGLFAASLTYEQRLKMNDVWEGSLGFRLRRQPYDGHGEDSVTVFAGMDWRF